MFDTKNHKNTCDLYRNTSLVDGKFISQPICRNKHESNWSRRLCKSSRKTDPVVRRRYSRPQLLFYRRKKVTTLSPVGGIILPSELKLHGVPNQSKKVMHYNLFGRDTYIFSGWNFLPFLAGVQIIRLDICNRHLYRIEARGVATAVSAISMIRDPPKL